jgi:uncharacterized NAD-dependent epimerase/dehydratase family protein
MVILAEGNFSPLESKTANQAIRYIPEEVVAVIDGPQSGRNAQEVLGFGENLEASLTFKPDTLLIGIAPTGGRLPDSWRNVMINAIRHKLHVISGLHTYLSDDEELAALAQSSNVTLTDLRKVSPEYEVVADGLWQRRKAKTILTVGTDCNVGKMTASYELHKEFLRRGLHSDFVATGQTGILLSGKGFAVDSILSDYVAGGIELEVEKSIANNHDFIHIEGQGSLTHQGYSSVTLGLMHGVMPDAMILVHHPARHTDDYGFRLDDLPRCIELHEKLMAPFKQSKIAGIAINTVMMTSQQITAAKKEIERQTGLPVANVLTPEVSVLADALLNTCKKK